jgi:hypothetical protein
MMVDRYEVYGEDGSFVRFEDYTRDIDELVGALKDFVSITEGSGAVKMKAVVVIAKHSKEGQ